MSKTYPLDIKNICNTPNTIMSKGHHDFDEFEKEVRKQGFHWTPSKPKHIWMKAVPNNRQKGSRYYKVEKGIQGAFPATVSEES